MTKAGEEKKKYVLEMQKKKKKKKLTSVGAAALSVQLRWTVKVEHPGASGAARLNLEQRQKFQSDAPRIGHCSCTATLVGARVF